MTEAESAARLLSRGGHHRTEAAAAAAELGELGSDLFPCQRSAAFGLLLTVGVFLLRVL